MALHLATTLVLALYSAQLQGGSPYHAHRPGEPANITPSAASATSLASSITSTSSASTARATSTLLKCRVSGCRNSSIRASARCRAAIRACSGLSGASGFHRRAISRLSFCIYQSDGAGRQSRGRQGPRHHRAADPASGRRRGDRVERNLLRCICRLMTCQLRTKCTAANSVPIGRPPQRPQSAALG